MAGAAKAKGKKIGRSGRKGSTQRSKARFNACQDNTSKRIIKSITHGNPNTKKKVKPKLTDLKDGTFKISGFPGYLFVAHNKTLVRK